MQYSIDYDDNRLGIIVLTLFKTNGDVYMTLRIVEQDRQSADTLARMFCILADKYLESRQT